MFSSHIEDHGISTRTALACSNVLVVDPYLSAKAQGDKQLKAVGSPSATRLQVENV